MPEFKKHFAKYSFSKLSQWQVSRHRRHIEDDYVAQPKDALGEETAETVKLLNKINKKLLAFARRSERSGKSAQHAISAYSTIIRTVEMMERLKAPESKPEGPKTFQEYEAAAQKLWEAFKKQAKPEELDPALDERLKQLVRQPGVGDWFASGLRQTYATVVAENTERVIDTLLGDREYREQLRARLLATDSERIMEMLTASPERCEKLRLALLEKDGILAEPDDELIRLRAAVPDRVPAVPDTPIELGSDVRALLEDAERRAEAISVLTSDYWPQWCEATAATNQLLRDYGQPYDVCWYPPREIRRPG